MARHTFEDERLSLDSRVMPIPGAFRASLAPISDNLLNAACTQRNIQNDLPNMDVENQASFPSKLVAPSPVYAQCKNDGLVAQNSTD